jgi:bacillithiol system protein YtxJ
LFSIFSKKDSSSAFSWKNIHDEAELKNLLSDSAFSDSPIVFFKHSPRCGISRMVISQFEKKHHQLSENQTFYLIDVLSQRHLSNFLAAEFQIQHESPQLLIISSGKCISASSHDAILNVPVDNFIS